MAPTHANDDHDAQRRLHGRRADEALLPVLFIAVKPFHFLCWSVENEHRRHADWFLLPVRH
jgi:hypothetical protein